MVINVVGLVFPIKNEFEPADTVYTTLGRFTQTTFIETTFLIGAGIIKPKFEAGVVV